MEQYAGNKVTTEQIYTRLKNRLYSKLAEEPYESEDGVIIDPVPARDLAAMGGLILKMIAHEEVRAKKEEVKAKVATIPSMPG